MKKIFTIILLFISYTSFAQSWQQTGNTLQRKINGSDTSYRFSLGSPGYMYLYTKLQVDALLATKSPILTGTNGNTKVGTAIQAGGTLLHPTTIFTNGNLYYVGTPDGNTGLGIGVAGVGVSFLNPDSIYAVNSSASNRANMGISRLSDGHVKSIFTDLSAGIVIANDIDHKAATYNSVTDFTTAHSIPDVEWVGSRGYALDNTVIHKTGIETIGGSKSFSDTFFVLTSGLDKKGIRWNANSDYGALYFESLGSPDGPSNLIFENGDNIIGSGQVEGFTFRKTGGGDAPTPTPVLDIAHMDAISFTWRDNQVATYTKVAAILNFPSTAAQTSSVLTVSVTGAVDGQVVSVGVPNASNNDNSCFTAYVSASNVVTVKLNNYSAGAIDPASGTFTITVFK